MNATCDGCGAITPHVGQLSSGYFPFQFCDECRATLIEPDQGRETREQYTKRMLHAEVIPPNNGVPFEMEYKIHRRKEER